jgi:hypothetical protein
MGLGTQLRLEAHTVIVLGVGSRGTTSSGGHSESRHGSHSSSSVA